MKQRGGMELVGTELGDTVLVDDTVLVNDTVLVDDTVFVNAEQLTQERTGPAEQDPGEQAQDQADLDTALARTLRRFIAEVSKADERAGSSEEGQKRAHPLREQGRRAAHKLWGR
jgi:hypothetical protein